MEITARERDGIAILAVKGKIIFGDESSEFRDKTRECLKGGKCNMILDMENVDYIDSSGLGELISLDRDLQAAGGKLKLVELDQKHVDLLVITKLNVIFDIFKDEQDAINSFFPDRQVSTFDLLEFVHDIKDEKDGKESKT